MRNAGHLRCSRQSKNQIKQEWIPNQVGNDAGCRGYVHMLAVIVITFAMIVITLGMMGFELGIRDLVLSMVMSGGSETVLIFTLCP